MKGILKLSSIKEELKQGQKIILNNRIETIKFAHCGDDYECAMLQNKQRIKHHYIQQIICEYQEILSNGNSGGIHYYKVPIIEDHYEYAINKLGEEVEVEVFEKKYGGSIDNWIPTILKIIKEKDNWDNILSKYESDEIARQGAFINYLKQNYHSPIKK